MAEDTLKRIVVSRRIEVRSNRASRHIITLSWFEGGSGYSAATQRGEFLMKELSDAAVAFAGGAFNCGALGGRMREIWSSGRREVELIGTGLELGRTLPNFNPCLADYTAGLLGAILLLGYV
jgi:hypothetical protein